MAHRNLADWYSHYRYCCRGSGLAATSDCPTQASPGFVRPALQVYEATRKFLSIILREARFEETQLFEFYAGTSDAEFLFDSAVVAYLEQLRKRAVHMRTAQRVYEHMPVGDERSRHVQNEHDDLVWLTDQLTAMSKVFSPYLAFSHVK